MTLDEFILEMTEKIHLQNSGKEIPGTAFAAGMPLYCSVMPEYGDGFCRIFRISEFASILLIDACFREKLCFRIPQGSFYYFSYYFILDASLCHPGGRCEKLQPHTVYTNALFNDEAAETVFRAGKAIRGLIVLVSTGEYRLYLSKRLPEYIDEDIDAILYQLYSIDGIRHLPELTTIYNQLSSFNGYGIVSQLFIESKFNELISLFLQNYQKNRQDKESTPNHRIKMEDLPHISDVKQHLSTHLEGPVNMAYLARMACMSESKLKYCFRQATGLSISGWRQRVRMQIARELLLTTVLPVSEIASRVGYHKAGSFSEAFTRSEGISPSEFRLAGRMSN